MKRMLGLFSLLGLLSGLAGCMTYDPGQVGSFGSTVYQPHYQQIANKELAANPGTDVSPTGTDGPLTEKVLDSFRGVTGKAEQVAQPIQINIGDPGSN
ncbi:MAG: hypothetical protein A2Y50_10990 [Pseudomonadales bacterium RIFCSPLOWO2_12_59_9]|nr:MAG: hypothetical protein A2Y50_10990 [Pseudomonadales bacterium RIFCSPLOWO2_12_59_9]